MRVFITGGTGSIGSNVVPALLKDGAEVFGLTRTEAGEEKLEAAGVTPVAGDVTKPDDWLGTASKCDVLIRASAVSFGRRSGKSWLENAIAQTRTETEGLIKAANIGTTCKALLYTSGFFVNGSHGDTWVSEDADARPLLLANIHRAGEKLISEAAQNLPAFSLRIGFVYAPEGNFAKHVLDEAAKGRFKYVGTGQNYMPFVHIDDVVSAYMAGIDRVPTGKALNVVDNTPLQMRSFVEKVVPHFGKKSGGVPLWLATAIAGKPLPEMFHGSYRLRNDRAKDLLHWQPTYPTIANQLDGVINQYLNNR